MFSESLSGIVCEQQFLLQICRRRVEKKSFLLISFLFFILHCFLFLFFHLHWVAFKYLLQAKKKQTVPLINVKTKVFLKRRH